MKGNKKILVVIALLLLISVGYTTYAIYRSNATATGTLTAANWSVTVDGNDITTTDGTLTFDIDDINWTTHLGKNDKIAPGDTGTIEFTVDASGSEVDVIVESSITAGSLPEGFTAEVTSGDNGKVEIPYATGAGSMQATITIAVTWAGDINDDATKDADDKSFRGESLSIPVTITARQKLASDSNG